jgi:hypothetical protein
MKSFLNQSQTPALAVSFSDKLKKVFLQKKKKCSSTKRRKLSGKKTPFHRKSRDWTLAG